MCRDSSDWAEKPKVTDEVKTGLFALGATLWSVVPEVYRASVPFLAIRAVGVLLDTN